MVVSRGWRSTGEMMVKAHRIQVAGISSRGLFHSMVTIVNKYCVLENG
jgi:hypothetical protein